MTSHAVTIKFPNTKNGKFHVGHDNPPFSKCSRVQLLPALQKMNEHTWLSARPVLLL